MSSDLIEYFIVTASDQPSLAMLVPALADLVDSATIRILDVAVLVRDREGVVVALEVETVESLSSLAELNGEVGALLSDHDLDLAAHAIRPGSVGLVLVTEDRWAAQLSAAARRAGGQIVAGERIPQARLAAVLAGRTDERKRGA